MVQYRYEIYSDETALKEALDAFTGFGMKPISIYPVWEQDGTRHLVVWWECEDADEDEPL